MRDWNNNGDKNDFFDNMMTNYMNIGKREWRII